MISVALALCAHAGNAVVFVVDKTLLRSKGGIGSPARYAFYSALLGGLAVLLLFFEYESISWTVFGWLLAGAVFHIIALYLFFWTLKRGEPSRVVPIVGSSVPVFTVLMARWLLGEHLSGQRLVATLFLILGGIVLSVKISRVKGLGFVLVGIVVLSGFFFAANFILMKHVYGLVESFLPVFAYSRVVESLMALAIFSPLAVSEIYLRASKKKDLIVGKTTGVRFLLGGVGMVFVFNKALAAAAYLLQHWAISIGSVSVVNSLQGVQYLFLLLLAATVSRWRPDFFKEEFGKMALMQKIGGSLLIVLGLALIV